ncbi:hypothetical protein [Phaeovulum sp. NW3]|uniref:hypothetical protein n=1 Tax=Phaeovulum sp. NW3 TaxID=2934933 RepID=UPI002022052E|nr:hypothetical protein [Phaeovulum sp. NW3]MCL7464755.1 hypothetical protein [Phaeovulum sp. NW3]
MKTMTLAALIALAPAVALADGKGKHRFNHQDQFRHEYRVQGCPPGLAKKNPPCVPPGQAKKWSGFRKGDRIRDGYVLVRDPWRYGLDRGATYYRVGDDFYRVNRKTGEVLELMGALSRVLN